MNNLRKHCLPWAGNSNLLVCTVLLSPTQVWWGNLYTDFNSAVTNVCGYGGCIPNCFMLSSLHFGIQPSLYIFFIACH